MSIANAEVGDRTGACRADRPRRGAWRYRRILWFFASRRIKERYEDATLGRFWMFVQPLAPILITTLIFGSMLQVPSDDPALPVHPDR